MGNRLAEEHSLYLKQHGENPVDWYPWGEEPWAKARETGKPVIVSIGYSSCHWCHVMAHESFESLYIAKLMNEHFICIKVDREERPDIDHLYMEAVQMMNGGHGGWPLNVFCLPDGRPFAGGTYFPPDDRRGGGVVPWPQLLMRVADYYKRSRSDLEENAEAVVSNLAAGDLPVGVTGDGIEGDAFFQALEAILKAADEELGGFGSAPKFPPSMTLDFLLAMRGSAAVEEWRTRLGERLDRVINTTLTAMAHGGLFDQLGGGFSRYCVDRNWVIPHFEKMLYDNGLLLDVYSKSYRRYPKPLYEVIVEETIAWLEREMRGAAGGWLSSIDADSEGQEGAFYVWSPEAVRSVLGEEVGSAFCEAYGITEAGNFEEGTSNPVLLAETFKERVEFNDARQKLLTARATRAAPGKDQKILLTWNCLVVKGLVEAGFTFGRPEWVEQSMEVFEWLWTSFTEREGEMVRLRSVFYDGAGALGVSSIDGYAFMAEASLTLASVADWIRPGSSSFYVECAGLLLESADILFGDRKAVGYFFNPSDGEALIHRKKEWFDNAIPSGNSSMAHGLKDMYALTGETKWLERFERLRIAYPGLAVRAPQAVSYALSGFVSQAIGVVVIKVKGDAGCLEELRKVIVSKPWRRIFIELTDEADRPEGFQFCVGTQCMEPTTDLARIADWL